MKKLFALSAMALAAGTAFAQSGVTVYGIADVGVNRVSGVKGSSVKQLVSGVMDGSRLGFRGNEDLGSGWRAIFTLEHRLELDTGGINNRPPSGSQVPDRLSTATKLGLPSALQGVVSAVATNGIGSTIGVNLANNFWDRQAFAGLVTPVGAVLAGRQYTPAYEVSAAFDTMGTQSALAFGQVASIPSSIDIRVSNALQYRAQVGGFTAGLMAAAGEGSTSTGRLMGGMAMYKTDAFSVGLGYNTRKNEKELKSLTSTVFGVSANFGPGTAFFEYVKVKDDNPTGVSGISALILGTPQLAVIGATNAAAVQAAFINGLKQDASAMHVGYRTVFGANTVYVAYSKLNDKRPANADTASYGIGYTYALSKRTDINAIMARFVNNDNAQAAPGQAGSLGGVTTSAGVDATSFTLGLRHRF